MVKSILIIGLLLFAASFNSYAADSDRIDQLEKELQETKARLSKIEALIDSPGNVQNSVTSGEGWKSVASWRKLATGMSPGDAHKILGEPHRVEGGPFAHWYYQNNGRITFYQGKVYGWSEPRQ